MAGSVPDLGLDDFSGNGNGSGLELDADGGLGVEAELVLGEPGEQLGLPHGGVADHHDLEHIVDPLVAVLSIALRVDPIHFFPHLLRFHKMVPANRG